jgi:outer membrane protein TolC
MSDPSTKVLPITETEKEGEIMTKQVIVKTETKVSIAQTAAMLDGSNANELIAQFNEAKAAIKQLELQKAQAEKALRELMGDAEIGIIAGVERVKIASRSRKDINKDDLMSVFPEAYALCLKESTYTVLTATS